MGNRNRALKLTLWIATAILLSPLGFNCHSVTDQSAAVRITASQPDDADQTVHEMETATAADGAHQSDAKVRLTPQAMLSASQATSLGLSAKLSSPADAIVPKGTELLALYDNDCRKKNGSPLRFEAEAYRQKEDVSLAVLESQAEADSCLVRVDENHVRQWIAPTTDVALSNPSQAVQAQSITAQATVNDPRLSEAKQVIFSKALQSWDWFFSGSGINKDVLVAVVDTGISYAHPDLADNVYTNSSGNHGIDFVNSDDDPVDDNGHGTHVSGIIGARANNGIGITGIIGLHVKLMGVKVLDAQGSGSEANIVNGIRYAADQGAKVINMSVGGNFESPTIRDAMVYAAGKGVVIVVAAGNDGVVMDASTNFYAPSGYAKDIPGAIAVGSVDAVTGARSSFSNVNPTYVWIGAPGSNGILSTYTGNSYTNLQGTSMASPAVAGAAALLVGAFQSHAVAYVPADVIGLLTDSARPVTTLGTFFRNGATLDVERAGKLFYSRYVMAGNGGTEAQ